MSSRGRDRHYRDPKDDDRKFQEFLRFDESKYSLSQIVVSNIDERIMRESIEDQFSRYGRILGVSMHRGFAYIQYDTESSAHGAIKAENDSMFMGKKIDVRLVKDSRKAERPRFLPVQAGRRRISPPLKRDNYRSSFRDRSPVRDDVYRRDEYNSRSRNSPKRDADERNRKESLSDFTSENRESTKANDCEIIAFDKEQRVYAEVVEWKLKARGLQVDILFPKQDSPLVDILDDIGSRGCLYAIVISPENEVRKSVTVHILVGDTQEHRNMPVNDAMDMITRHFENYKRESTSVKDTAQIVNSNQPVYSKEKIQQLLRLLADGQQISLTELDHVIHHLQEFREFLLASEETKPSSFSNPSTTRIQAPPTNPGEELKKTILNLFGNNGVVGGGSATTNQSKPQILSQVEDNYIKDNNSGYNRSFMPNIKERSLYNSGETMKSASLTSESTSVKKALDTLLQGDPSQLFQNRNPLPVAGQSRNVPGPGGNNFISPPQQPLQQQFYQDPIMPSHYPTPVAAAVGGGGYQHPNLGAQPMMGMHLLQQQQMQRPAFNRQFF